MQVVQSGRSSQLYECTVHRPAGLRLRTARTLRSVRNCYALIADCCVPVETARVVYASAFRMLNEVFCGEVRVSVTGFPLDNTTILEFITEWDWRSAEILLLTLRSSPIL